MIDTVIIRLHDLNKYAYHLRCLNFYNDDNGYSTHLATIPKDEIAELRKQKRTENEIVEIMQSHTTGNFLTKTRVAKQMNASSHYEFAYMINYTKDFVEFNFSVPKYKYGTNITMFMEHSHDRDFKYHNSVEFEYNVNKSYDLFISFLKNFFHYEFILCKPVDWKDVEIFRIDVCFNQLFRSKEEALLYLDYQKRLEKKYVRNKDEGVKDYATSLMYVTKLYSAKIYHKGTEYQKHDLKEHLKINEKKRSEYFRTKQLQAFADRILRYELTIRNGMINYLHKHYIFRKNCKHFKTNYRQYRMVENAIQRNDRISKKIGLLAEVEKESFLFNNPYQKIPKEYRQIYKSVTKMITRRRYFKIEVDDNSSLFNSRSMSFESDDVKFCSKLLKLCFKKLSEFIAEYQIKELPAEEIIKMKLDYYNNIHTVKLPVAEMLHFYTHLTKHGSFKEAGKYLHKSRATLFRYKQRFKKLGVSDKCLKLAETGFSIPHAPLDFKDYHSTIIYDNNILRGINTNL